MIVIVPTHYVVPVTRRHVAIDYWVESGWVKVQWVGLWSHSYTMHCS